MYIYIWASQCNSKESAWQCRRLKRHGLAPWVRKIPWRRKWQPTPVFLPGKSHGQRSLVSYSPWGCKELDMTEVTKDTHTHTHIWRERETIRDRDRGRKRETEEEAEKYRHAQTEKMCVRGYKDLVSASGPWETVVKKNSFGYVEISCSLIFP